MVRQANPNLAPSTNVVSTVIPKSVSKSRIDANAKFVELSKEEITELLKISEAERFRACGPEWTGWGDLGFPDRIK